ncbi:hypothetical protein FFI94_025240 [Rhodococcus sp. KBS0724]|nr:hypothetical protein FFI94_025240 [Rhodococcus sp. KBS0724]
MVPAVSLDDACVAPMDELRRLAYRLMSIDQHAAEAVHSIVGSLTAPLQVLVAGRSGVGRSAVTRLLESDAFASHRVGGAPVIPTETRAFDVPGATDPDLSSHCVVVVVVDAIRDADRRAVGQVSDHCLAVLNKADHIGDGWEDALARAAEISGELSAVTVPLVALTGQGREALFDELSPILELWWWRRVDGIRSILARVAAGAEVGESAGARDEVEQYLRTDSGLIFAATGALTRPELCEFVADAPPTPTTAEDARRCAQWWGGPTQREHPAWAESISLVHRAYVRRWVLLGGERDRSEVSA